MISSAPLKTLKEHWQRYNGSKTFDHFYDFADHYQEILPYPIEGGSQIKILEIGVQSGGSLLSWKSWFNDQLYIVGVDIDERCSRSHDPEQDIYVEIGSQLNTTFLHEVCSKHGPFDLVIDDGGHTAKMIHKSLHSVSSADSCMKYPSWYVVEDTMTMSLCDEGYCSSATDISNLASIAFFALHDEWHTRYGPAGRDKKNFMSGKITEVKMFNSMILFKHDLPKPMRRFQKGKDGFPNEERKRNDPVAYKAN